nr:MAG TPA: hypothetical protein [Bacteriophage sp.]
MYTRQAVCSSLLTVSCGLYLQKNKTPNTRNVRGFFISTY